MKTEAIQDRVRILLQEATANESGLESEITFDDSTDTDEKALNTLIADRIEEALTFVLRNAAESYLEPRVEQFQFDSVPTGWGGDLEESWPNEYPMHIYIPRDKFLRFLWVTTDQWNGLRVHETITPDDAEWARLRHHLSSGTTARPAVGQSHHVHEGVFYEAISLYCVDDSVAEVTLAYIPWPEEDAETGWPVNTKLVDGFLHYLTYLVMQTLHDTKADEQMAQAIVCIGRGDALKQS